MRQVIILHNNDLHFQTDNLTMMVDLVRQFRALHRNILYLNAGDLLLRRGRWHKRQPAVNDENYPLKMRAMVDALNSADCDVMLLGNHDLGYEGTITRDEFARRRFPLLGTNIEVTTDLFPQPLPSISFTMPNKIRIGVLGITCGGFGNVAGIRLTNQEQAIADWCHLRRENDLFILLAHLGVAGDAQMAAEYGTLFDLLIGGHSHVLIDNPKIVNGLLVTQAGDGYGSKSYLGVIRVTFDAAGKVVAREAEMLRFDNTGLETPSRLLTGR